MKNKLISMVVAIAMLPGTMCLAAEPKVTREYITRKAAGDVSSEERILVDCPEIQLEEKNYIIVSFFGSDKNMIAQWKTEASVDELSEDEILFDFESLSGTEYITIDFPGTDSATVEVPLKL